MGLKETIASAVSAGFTALGNLIETVTYKAQGVSLYDTSTGTFTRVETSFSVSGIFVEYEKKEIDGAIVKVYDQKFLFQQALLTVKPKITDRLLRTDGRHWEVMAVAEDPAHATWELQMRAQHG